MKRASNAFAILVCAALAGCQAKGGGALTATTDRSEAVALLQTINDQAQTCWMKSKDKAFRAYRVIPELDTRVGKVIAVVMGDRAAQDLALCIAAGKHRFGIHHFQQHFLADEVETGIAHQRAGQQAGFGENLKAVADAKNAVSGSSLAAQGIHDGRSCCNGTGAQIVAIGKAAGNYIEIGFGQGGFGVPDDGRRLAADLRQRGNHVAVAVEARKEDNGGGRHRMST